MYTTMCMEQLHTGKSYPQVNPYIQCIPFKISPTYVCMLVIVEIIKLILKFKWKFKDPRSPKERLKKANIEYQKLSSKPW